MEENGTLARNVKHTIDMFPRWAVIFDTDVTCKTKFKQLEFIQDSTYKWYEDVSVQGKFRSDFCRLIQLYIHGGLYFDNDFEVVDTSFVTRSHNFLSVKSIDPHTLFQAILLATPGHPIVKLSIDMFQSYIQGKLSINGWIGPVIMYKAVFTNRSLAYLMTERNLPLSYLLGRRRTDACHYGVFDRGKFIGYSRMMTWNACDDKKVSCSAPPTIAPPPISSPLIFHAPPSVAVKV